MTPTRHAADAAADDLHELRVQVQSLAQEVAELRARLASADAPRGGFARVLLVKQDGTNLASWRQQWAGSNNADLTPFVSGLAGTVAPVDPRTAVGGGAGVFPVLQLRNGSNTAFVHLGGDHFIRVRITAATQDGGNKRWKYSGEQVVKSAQGYGGFATVSGGLTFPTPGQVDYLYNHAEDMNGASGTYGNGVHSTNLASTGLDVVPFPTNRVVWARVDRPGGEGTLPEGWFDGDNGIDGPCTPP
jgi:hypothetical protein